VKGLQARFLVLHGSPVCSKSECFSSGFCSVVSWHAGETLRSSVLNRRSLLNREHISRCRSLQNTTGRHSFTQFSLFIVLRALRELPGSFDECSTKRHVAADLWTKPTDLSHRPACSLYRSRQLGNYIHHRHLLLLLSSKADTHFTVPQKVEG